jgi:hypothetical protein
MAAAAQLTDYEIMEAELAMEGEARYWAWVEAMEASDQTIRELNSYPEALEASPW